MREKEKSEKEDEELKQKEFEEREAEIWPKKKPVLSQKRPAKQSFNNPSPASTQ